jgi:hypothetical protein
LKEVLDLDQEKNVIKTMETIIIITKEDIKDMIIEDSRDLTQKKNNKNIMENKQLKKILVSFNDET